MDIGPFNHCWGGGLTVGSVTMLGGLPGAGKSTLVLQMADLIAMITPKERPVIYIAGEEQLESIKERADRLLIQLQDRIGMIAAMGGVEVGPILVKYKPAAVILDSLQGMFGEDAGMCIEVLRVLKKNAMILKAPIIVLSHVTKDGDYAGLMTYQHDVDTLIFLTPEEDDGQRILSVRKNRHGRAFIDSIFDMTERGLELVEHVNPGVTEEEETEE